MEQIFHPYEEWEDRKAGMYNHCSTYNTENVISECIKLLTNETEFYNTMLSISEEWVKSTETNLSNSNNNRRAWLGRAACCFKINVPENITQKAWLQMSPIQREFANKIADRFIKDWEEGQGNQIFLF